MSTQTDRQTDEHTHLNEDRGRKSRMFQSLGKLSQTGSSCETETKVVKALEFNS